MDIQKAILDDMQSLLLSKDITVETKEEGEKITVGILVGKGKKGGLPISFTCEKLELNDTFEIVLKMLQAQLVLYGIECLKKGKAVTLDVLDNVYIPEITGSLVHQDVKKAQDNIKEFSGALLSFNLFKNSLFDKDKATISKIKYK
jgi:hypothetical protein